LDPVGGSARPGTAGLGGCRQLPGQPAVLGLLAVRAVGKQQAEYDLL